MSILTVFVPLAIAFVLEMATFLCFKSLIDLTIFDATLILRHRLLHHLLGLAHLLLNILTLRLLLADLVLIVDRHGLLGTTGQDIHLSRLHLLLLRLLWRVKLIWRCHPLDLGRHTARGRLRLLLHVLLGLLLVLLLLSVVHCCVCCLLVCECVY